MEEVIAKDYLRFIEGVLWGLPEQTKQIFRLCRQQHKTYDEVATILGISRNTVKKTPGAIDAGVKGRSRI